MTIDAMLTRIEGVSLTDSHQYYRGTPPGLPLLVVDRPDCQAVIALQGAQILEFSPAGSPPLLWLSPGARFEPGQAIRGGIPLCAPWFGPHPTDSNKPNHGFARNQPWQLTTAAVTEDDELSLCFTLEAGEYSRRLYPFDFTLQLEMRLGTALTQTLTISNHSAETMPFSWALHSYFPVEDLAKVRLSGLSGLASVDNTNGRSLPPLAGELCFSGEVDRFFTGASKKLQLNNQPPLLIEGDNCPTVITWNPGREKAAQMADIGVEHFTGFVCVERGAAFEDAWQIPAGQSRQAKLRLGR